MGKDHAVPRDSTNSSYNKQQLFSKLSEIILSGMLSCVWLFCNHVDCSLPGSSVHGMFQARILEWVAISYSRGCSQPRDRNGISCFSCIGRQILLPLSHLESPLISWASKISKNKIWEYLAELCFILLSANIKKIPLSLSFYIKKIYSPKK